MALHWQIQRRVFIVICHFLWVILAAVSSVDSSPLTSSSDIEVYMFTSSVDGTVYYRNKRAADETSLQDPVSEDASNFDTTQDLDDSQLTSQNGNSESIISNENDRDYDLYQEQIKPKLYNKQPKYIANEVKNYSSNKLSVDTKHLTSNESVAEKQKSFIYGPQGYASNKKDIKSHTYSEYPLKVNTTTHTVPNHYTSDKIKEEEYSEVEDEMTNTTKAIHDSLRFNDTHVMNDQPVISSSDVLHNATEFSDEDSLDILSRNITDTTFEDNNTTNADGRTMPPSDGVDVFVISGTILGTVVLLGLIAGGGFVVYRNRMWNKPQTLSDKCSNADSSGYIDDSTLRENSEEMYSLDNDSFLNSLEAMTIQNYWTDNVKHTKL